MRPARALIGDALDNPEPFVPRQARSRAAGQHAISRSKQSVRLLQQSGLSQRRSGCQPSSRWRDFRRPTATHALHGVWPSPRLAL